MKLQEAASEIWERYYYATGEPPKLVHCNRSFKHDFINEFAQIGVIFWDMEDLSIPSNEFQFKGTTFRCDLPVEETTLLTTHECKHNDAGEWNWKPHTW